jgi:hypothetical protein
MTFGAKSGRDSDSQYCARKFVNKECTDELKEMQALSLQGRYPLALALACLPRSKGWCVPLTRNVGHSLLTLLEISYHSRCRWYRQNRADMDTL